MWKTIQLITSAFLLILFAFIVIPILYVFVVAMFTFIFYAKTNWTLLQPHANAYLADPKVGHDPAMIFLVWLVVCVALLVVAGYVFGEGLLPYIQNEIEKENEAALTPIPQEYRPELEDIDDWPDLEPNGPTVSSNIRVMTLTEMANLNVKTGKGDSRFDVI